MLDDARVVACQAELADAAPRAPCPDAERLTLETVCRFAVVRGLSTAGGSSSGIGETDESESAATRRRLTVTGTVAVGVLPLRPKGAGPRSRGGGCAEGSFRVTDVAAISTSARRVAKDGSTRRLAGAAFRAGFVALAFRFAREAGFPGRGGGDSKSNAKSPRLAAVAPLPSSLTSCLARLLRLEYVCIVEAAGGGAAEPGRGAMGWPPKRRCVARRAVARAAKSAGGALSIACKSSIFAESNVGLARWSFTRTPGELARRAPVGSTWPARVSQAAQGQLGQIGRLQRPARLVAARGIRETRRSSLCAARCAETHGASFGHVPSVHAVLRDAVLRVLCGRAPGSAAGAGSAPGQLSCARAEASAPRGALANVPVLRPR